MASTRALNLPEPRWVDVNGPVHYRLWDGPPAGPTFVCVHGLGGSLLNWVPVAPGLARHGTVLALDLAGFGMTPVAARRTALGGNWRLLDGFLAALELGPVILVGNSMGGMIALIQAAHAPESVRSLVLVDAAFPRTWSRRGQFDPRITALFALYSTGQVGEWLGAIRSRRMGAERLVRQTLEVIAADPSSIDKDMVDALIEQTREREAFEYAVPAFMAAARSIFRAQAAPGRYRELVRRVDRAALVLHGDGDRLVPLDLARAACAQHPNWKLVVMEGLGHVPQMEAPGRFLAEVKAWLADPAGGAGPPTSPRPS